jgi:hypothetical protein
LVVVGSVRVDPTPAADASSIAHRLHGLRVDFGLLNNSQIVVKLH